MVYRELAKQDGWNRIWAIALSRFGLICPLDLRGAQADIAHDGAGDGVAHHAGARHIGFLIMPGVTAEPLVERFPPAIELRPLVVATQRPGRG